MLTLDDTEDINKLDDNGVPIAAESLTRKRRQ